jgi:hypothetical protein
MKLSYDGSVEKGAMNEPNKYKVVYVSPEGIPFLQQLTVGNKPAGEWILPPEADFLRHVYPISYRADWCFEPDPAQLDAIMLQQEYDPMKEHGDKLQLLTEINKHNKLAAVSTTYTNDILKFFKTLRPGDKFWTGVDKQYVIRSPIVNNKRFVTVINPDQQEDTLNIYKFRRLYRKRPRSFSREVKT